MELWTPGWEKEALDGEQSRGSSGPAQQLLLPAPLAPESLSLLQSAPSPAKGANVPWQKEESSPGTLPRNADPSCGRAEGSTCDAPKRKPKKTRQDREKAQLLGQAAADKHPEQMGSDSWRVGQERGSQPQPQPGALSVGKPNSLAAKLGMEQDGSGQRRLGKAQGKNLRLPIAFPTTDELGEQELWVLLLGQIWCFPTSPPC